MSTEAEIATRRMDRLTLSLRWLLLMAATIILSFIGQVNTVYFVVIILIAVMVVHTLGLALLEFLDYHPPQIMWLSLCIDFGLAVGLFIVGADDAMHLIWLGLLPGLPLALRRNWLLPLLVVMLFSVAQMGVVLYLQPGNVSGLITLGGLSLAIWLITVGVALFARRLHASVVTFRRQEEKTWTQRLSNLRAQTRAVYDIASMASATLDYERLLDAALRRGAQGTGATSVAASNMISMVLFFRDDKLRVESSWRLPTTDTRVICDGHAGVIGEVIRTSEALVIHNPAADPELKAFVGFQTCRSVMVLPLRAGYETYGVVVYGHPSPDYFDEDQRAFLAAIVNQVILSLQNAQLYRNLREEKERLIVAHEEAQKKLARDLHDGPTQSVAAMAMRANFTRRLMDRDPNAAVEELVKMEDLARRTTKEIRHMLFTLRPLALESQGLAAALQQLAEKMHETHNQNVIIEVEAGVEDKLEKNQQGVLFYIAEEAVNNARKHAQAPHIWVRIHIQRNVLVQEILDDGVGFDVSAVDSGYEKRGSLGMVNMRERAEMLSGAVKIESTPGKGTHITILVPLREGV